uniref:RNA-dependent RNA polymerase n=1 Tax=Pinela virus TaxID=1888321 RepID=A0A1B2RVN6_9VIRU|nr:RNA-dependent RNA polymerase [Pinela virus]
MPVRGCLMPNVELEHGCKILEVPADLEREVTCREGTVMVMGEHPEKEFGLHKHRVVDELQTICNRHLKATPPVELDSLAWKLFHRRMCTTSRLIGRVPTATIACVLEGKSGRRRKRFFQGIKELGESPVCKKDAAITEMQKLEMYESCKLEVKEDRGIQFRSVKYNVALARHLHNIEKRVIGMHPDGYHPVMKGATPQQRAERLAIGASSFRRPVYLLLDHSRFDAHVNVALLREEHKFYLRCRGKNAELARLLKMQIVNRGRSKGGVKYRTLGKRMSGDINTGLGNTIINYCIIMSWLDASSVKGHVYLDGDDSVVIIEKEDECKLVPLENHMGALGMVTIMDRTEDFWRAEFCQSRPVLVDGTVRFIRNPQKVLATVGRSAERLDPSTAAEVLRASAMCELAMNGNAPVISKFCRRILEHLGDGRVVFSNTQLWKAEQYGIRFKIPQGGEVDPESRYTFWRAWDIDPGMQEAYEQQDLIWSAFMSEAKRRRTRVKVDLADDPDEFWLGRVIPSCDCGSCPEYDSQVAYDHARLWQ